MGYDQNQITGGGGAASPLADSFINGLMRNVLGQKSGVSPYDSDIANLTKQLNDPASKLPINGIDLGEVQKKLTGLQSQRTDYLSRFDQANPLDSTTGIYGAINDAINGRDTSAQKQATTDLINQRQATDTANLSESFAASGAGSRGTPAAVALAKYKAMAAPELTNALSQIDFQNQAQRQQGLGMLLSLFGGITDKGTPQAYAQTVFTPNSWTQALSALGGAAQGGASAYKDIKTAG